MRFCACRGGIRDTVVLMPPYRITDEQLEQAVEVLAEAIEEVCGMSKGDQ